MALIQQLTGSKAEFIEFLNEQVAELRASAKGATAAGKTKLTHVAMGMEMARKYVESWQPTDAPVVSGNGSVTAEPAVTEHGAWGQDG